MLTSAPIKAIALAVAAGLILALSLAPSILSQEVDKPVSPALALEQMGWLAGTWSGDMWGGRFVAYYTTPEGGKIISHSRLLKGTEEAFYEFEVFEGREQTVHLQPFPGGQRAGGFTMTSHEPGSRKVTFENPKKDFPTRIVYHRVADDNLVITLSDPHGGSDKEERFDLKLEAAASSKEK